MPEEIEIDTESLRKEIDDELEKSSGSLLRWISLTTAILAALAAIASLKAGGTVNEALVLKTEATNLQAQASDQWASRGTDWSGTGRSCSVSLQQSCWPYPSLAVSDANSRHLVE